MVHLPPSVKVPSMRNKVIMIIIVIGQYLQKVFMLRFVGIFDISYDFHNILSSDCCCCCFFICFRSLQGRKEGFCGAVSFLSIEFTLKHCSLSIWRHILWVALFHAHFVLLRAKSWIVGLRRTLTLTFVGSRSISSQICKMLAADTK